MRLVALLLVGLSLSGCVGVSTATLEPASEANFKPRDRELLSKVPYAKASIPEPYRRHIVQHHRRRRGACLLWHCQGAAEGRVADLGANRRDQGAAWTEHSQSGRTWPA